MSKKQTILIVDDVLMNILVLSSCLKDTYNIIYTTDSNECLRMASAEPFPDLILLDIIMPGIDGHEVFRLLKANPDTKSIPIIFVSQKDQIVDEEMGLNMGAADYITKPIEPEIVAARVNLQLLLKQQNDMLAKNEAQLSAILENSPVLITTKDLNGNIITANRQFEILGGKNHNDLIGTNITSLYPANDLDKVIESERLAQQGRIEIEEEFQHKDGTLYPYLSVKFPIRNSDDELIGTGTIATDITSRKLFEQSSRQAKKMEAVGHLTGGIAHDFNNLLAIILGNLELFLSKTELTEKNKIRFDNIKNAANRAAYLTSQLLGFSRSKPVIVEVTDIKVQMSNMDALFRRALTQQIEIVEEYPDELWHSEIDQGDFQDSLLNLVFNARDAMPDGGKLKIILSNCTLDGQFCDGNLGALQGEYVRLTISDTGEGISPEVIENIFDPFFTTKAIGKGTGLGLSLVFGFVKRSKGYIRVESIVGEGTSFHMYLPKSDLQPKKNVIQKNNAIPLQGRNEVLLLVDDEIDLLAISKETLESVGYKVLTACSGQDAIHCLEENSDISLLISDVIMPGAINGYQLVEICRPKYPEMKFLLCSGYVKSKQDEPNLISENFLRKPYSLQKLIIKVEEILLANNALSSLPIVCRVYR